MFEEITTRSDRRYKKRPSGKCVDCEFPGLCLGDCEECLRQIHFPDESINKFERRKYDCQYMADFYVGKYSHKNVSELIYAYRDIVATITFAELNMLSFGCGPCSDLLAIDFLVRSGEAQIDRLNYYGVEYCCDVWENIHSDIMRVNDFDWNINIFQNDICNCFEIFNQIPEFPTLITFQYIFSDLQKHLQARYILEFLEHLAELVNLYMRPNSYIVINDINLHNRKDGGRDYFDLFAQKLENVSKQKYYFNYDRTRKIFKYGQQRETGRLIFPIIQPNLYEPFDSCRSAQLIIKKENHDY